MIKAFRLFLILLHLFSQAALPDEISVQIRDLGLSKYGKLTSEFHSGYSQLTAKGRITLFSINYDIKSIAWTDSPTSEKSEYFIFLVINEEMWACPARYVLMDARGDKPMFSPVIGNCNSTDAPAVAMTAEGTVKITFLPDERGNTEEHWQYKDGILSKIVTLPKSPKGSKSTEAILP